MNLSGNSLVMAPSMGGAGVSPCIPSCQLLVRYSKKYSDAINIHSQSGVTKKCKQIISLIPFENLSPRFNFTCCHTDLLRPSSDCVIVSFPRSQRLAVRPLHLVLPFHGLGHLFT